MFPKLIQIPHIKQILTFKTFFKFSILLIAIYMISLMVSQISKTLLEYRYSPVLAYCQTKHHLLKKMPTPEQLQQANTILNNLQLEFMPTASLYFEQAVAYSVDKSEYIEALLQSYLFRLEHESQGSFQDNISLLAKQLIKKDKHSLYGHALQSMLQITLNNTVQAEKHLQDVADKHMIHKILDYHITQLKNLDSNLLFKKLDDMQNTKYLRGFHEKTLYELYINVGDYFLAKPILNERFIRFPNDQWAQIQMAKLLQKGENLTTFESLLQSKQLNPNNAAIQLAYANTKCTQSSFFECNNLYKKIISGHYDFNSRKTLIEAYFKLIFYYAKNNHFDLGYQQVNLMKKLFPEALNKIALHEAFLYYLDGKTLPAKTIFMLKEENLESQDNKIAQFFLANHYKNNNDIFEKIVQQTFNEDPFFAPTYLLYLDQFIKNNKQKSALDLATRYLFQAQISLFHVQDNSSEFKALLIDKALSQLKQSASRYAVTQKSALLSAYIGLMHLTNYLLNFDSYDLNQAQQYLNRALTKLDTNEKIYLLLGIVEHYKKNMYASDLFLKKSYALQEENANTLFWFAKNNLVQNKIPLAEVTLNKLLGYQDWKSPAMNLLILLQLQKNQNQKALLNLKELLKESPKTKESWRTLNMIEF